MPFLSESAIRDLCGKRVWERAEEILEWPALISLSACGENDSIELFGRCRGSEGGLYALRARVYNGSLAESNCSCPYEGNGKCKHLVALLLAYKRQQEKFQVYPALVEMVTNCSPETLHELVLTMVRRSPDLLPIIATSRDGGKDEPVRETLRRALSGRDVEDGAPVLERIFNQASQHEAKSDWFAAGEIWSVALEELAHAAAGFEEVYERQLEESDGYDDEGGDFGNEWARMALDGLGRALDQETLAPEARHAWARSIWEAERAAGACDYFSLPSLARELLIRFAPTDLWEDIEAQIRAELRPANRRSNWGAQIIRDDGSQMWEGQVSDDWERATNIEFLLGRLRATGRSEEAEDLIAEMGTPKQQFDLMLRRGKLPEAQKVARQNYFSNSHQLLECATQLDQNGGSELALQLVLDAKKRNENEVKFGFVHRASAEGVWLCEFYLRSKRPAEARAEAVQIFASDPTSTQFDRLKRSVELQGDWASLRDGIEEEVRSHAGKNWQGGSRADEVSLALALCEKDAQRIYALFQKLTRKERPKLLETVAAAIEGEMPEQALALWRELAEWTIENRDQNSARRSYASAAQALIHVRRLHDDLGSIDEWEDYLETLLGIYKSLRALADEFRKAGL